MWIILYYADNFIFHRYFHSTKIHLSYANTFILPRYFHPTQISLHRSDNFILHRYFYPTQILLFFPDTFFSCKDIYVMWIFLSSVKIFILYADSEKNYKNFQTLKRLCSIIERAQIVIDCVLKKLCIVYFSSDSSESSQDFFSMYLHYFKNNC